MKSSSICTGFLVATTHASLSLEMKVLSAKPSTPMQLGILASSTERGSSCAVSLRSPFNSSWTSSLLLLSSNFVCRKWNIHSSRKKTRRRPIDVGWCFITCSFKSSSLLPRSTPTKLFVSLRLSRMTNSGIISSIYSPRWQTFAITSKLGRTLSTTATRIPRYCSIRSGATSRRSLCLRFALRGRSGTLVNGTPRRSSPHSRPCTQAWAIGCSRECYSQEVDG